MLYTQDTLDSPAKVLLDPNLMSKDGTVAVSGTSFSQNGRYLAFSVSRHGHYLDCMTLLKLCIIRPLSVR